MNFEPNMILMREAEIEMQEARSSNKEEMREDECTVSNDASVSKAALAQRARREREREKSQLSPRILAQRLRRERERSGRFSESTEPTISTQTILFPGLPPRPSQRAQRLRRERERSGKFTESTEPTISTQTTFPGLPPRPCQHACFERGKEALLTVSVSPSSNVTPQQTPTQIDHSSAGTTPLPTDNLINSQKPSSLSELLSTVGKMERKKTEDFSKFTQPTLFPDLPPRPRQRARFEREKRAMLARSVSASLNVKLQETPSQFDHPIAGRTPLQTDSLLNSSRPSSLPDLHSVGGRTEAMRDTKSFPQESIQVKKEPVQTISFNEGINGPLRPRQLAQRLRRERERAGYFIKSTQSTTSTQSSWFPSLPPRPYQRARFEQEKQVLLTQSVSSSSNITPTKIDHSIAGTTPLQTDSLSNSSKSSSLLDLHSVGGRTELMRDTKSFPHEAYQVSNKSMQTTSGAEWNKRCAVQFQRAELFPMVEQMIKTKFRKYKMGKCGRFFDESGRLLSTRESQPLVAIKKTGLRDLQNDNRTVFRNFSGNFLRKETKFPDDAAQISGAEGPTVPRLQPAGNNSEVDLHLVHAIRKSDAEENKCCISDDAAQVLGGEVPTALRSIGTNNANSHLVYATTKPDEEQQNCCISDYAAQVLGAEGPTAPLQFTGTNDAAPHLVCATTKPDEGANKCCVSDLPQSEQFSEKRIISQPQAEITEPKSDGISVILRIPVNSTMNSCGNLSYDSPREHSQGHLAGINNPAIPSVEDSQMMKDQPIPVSSTMNSCANLSFDSLREHDQGQLSGVNNSAIPSVEDSRMMEDQPIPLSSMMNSCGNLSFDSLREHSQGQLAGVNNSAIPSVEDSQMMENQPIPGSSMMNSYVYLSSDSLREHGQGKLAGVNNPAISSVEDSQMMEEQPIPVSSMMNSCGNLSSDSLGEHAQGQSAGVNNPAVPSVEDSQVMEDQPWRERFIQLQNYLKRCDNSNQEDYVMRVKALTSYERSRHVIILEKRAIHLLVEEGRELQRMKVLNVLGNSAGNSYSC